MAKKSKAPPAPSKLDRLKAGAKKALPIVLLSIGALIAGTAITHIRTRAEARGCQKGVSAIVDVVFAGQTTDPAKVAIFCESLLSN